MYNVQCKLLNTAKDNAKTDQFVISLIN